VFRLDERSGDLFSQAAAGQSRGRSFTTEVSFCLQPM
jgi:hypothetical protein